MLILLMQFRPEGIMGNKELPEVFARIRERWKGRRLTTNHTNQHEQEKS
jgi:hypothetical protein